MDAGKRWASLPSYRGCPLIGYFLGSPQKYHDKSCVGLPALTLLTEAVQVVSLLPQNTRQPLAKVP